MNINDARPCLNLFKRLTCLTEKSMFEKIIIYSNLVYFFRRKLLEKMKRHCKSRYAQYACGMLVFAEEVIGDIFVLILLMIISLNGL